MTIATAVDHYKAAALSDGKLNHEREVSHLALAVAEMDVADTPLPISRFARPYCSMPMLGDYQPLRDRIKPRSRRHRLPGNQNIVCWRCNEDKGSLSLRRWANQLRAAGDPRTEHVAAFVARLKATNDALVL